MATWPCVGTRLGSNAAGEDGREGVGLSRSHGKDAFHSR